MKSISTLVLALACAFGFLARPATTAPDHSTLGVRGVILAFDNDRGGFVMYNPRVGRVAVKVDHDWTQVLVNQQPARLSDLQAGMHVIVSGPVSPATHRMRARLIRTRQ